MPTATVQVTNLGNIARQCGIYTLPPGVPVDVPPEFITMFGQDKELRYDFSKAPALLADRTEDGDIRLDWRSPLSAIDGYGRHGIWLIRALHKLGAMVLVRQSNWTDPNWFPADIRMMRAAAHSQLPSRVGVSFTLGYDPELYDHPSPIKVGVTQFETDRLPRVHVQNLNRCDHAVVTSSFNVKVFRNSGVHIPISVMTPGIPVDEFPYKERAKDGKFKVLILGALTPRKNPLGAIRIFQAASRGNDDWRLTIKTRQAAGLKAVQKVAATDPRIEIITTDTPPHQLNEFYYNNDCLLWPSKGEGVGLPPLEAMATGMELVCSDNSGMSDYLTDDTVYKIKMSGMESARGEDCFTDKYVEAYGDVGNWWVPNEKHAVKQLERCFSNWLDGKGKGKAAAEHVRANHTIEHSARDLIEVIEQYV